MKKSIYTVDQIDALLSGKGMAIVGRFDTVDDVTDPVEGGHYYIGTESPYDVCTYIGGVWVNAGPFQGERGEPFTYEDFTPEQLEALRGPEGPQGVGIAYIRTIYESNEPGVSNRYEIILQNGVTYPFNVYNGQQGPAGKPGETGQAAIVTLSGAAQYLALANNTDYRCADAVTALTITGFSAGDDGRSELWSIQFVAGEGITVMLPDTVVWNYGATPVFTAGSEYTLVFTPLLSGKVMGVWNEVEA